MQTARQTARQTAAEDTPTPTLLSDEEMKALPRKVGHRSFAQVQALFDENRARRETHQAEHCPLCVLVDRSEWPPCEAGAALWEQYQTQGIDLSTRSQLLKKHKKSCPDCLRKYRSWREVGDCPYGEQLSELELIYSRRLTHLRTRENAKRFTATHGRLPENKQEFLEWLAGEEHEQEEG